MKKLLLLALITLSTLSFAQELKTKTGIFPEKEMLAQNITIAKMSAEALSKDLPHEIDKYTTLVSVKNQEATLIYSFEINSGSKSDDAIRKEDRSRMQKAITTGVCQSASKLLEAKINISYIYLSAKTKAELFSFDISQKDCIGI